MLGERYGMLGVCYGMHDVEGQPPIFGQGLSTLSVQAEYATRTQLS